MTKAGEKTRRDLELSLYRITKGKTRTIAADRKLSISAVAEEAGVDPATIHNRYPEIADKIRELLGKESRQQRDISNQNLKKEKAKNRELREEIEVLKEQVAKLASINATLVFENTNLSAIANAKNVEILNKKRAFKKS